MTTETTTLPMPAATRSAMPTSPVLTIARRELAEGLRNRWVVSTTLLMAALASAIAALGSAPTGSTSRCGSYGRPFS